MSRDDVDVDIVDVRKVAIRYRGATRSRDV